MYDAISSASCAHTYSHAYYLNDCVMHYCSFRAQWAAAVTQASQKAAMTDDALITLTELVKGGRLDAVTAVPQWNVPVEPALFPGRQLVLCTSVILQVVYTVSYVS
jgi:hypothetical protein